MSDADPAPSLLGPTAWGIAVRAAGMALGFGVALFLARVLGAEDLGAYQGVLSIAIILASVAAATAERPAARRIAALPADDPEALGAEVGLAHLVVGLATLSIVVTMLVASLVPSVPDGAAITLRLAAFVVPGLALISLRQWIALPLRGVAVSIGPEQVALPLAFVGLLGLVRQQAELGASEALLAYAAACWLVWLVTIWWSGLLGFVGDSLRSRPADLGGVVRARAREGRSFVVLAIVSVIPIYATVPLVAVLLDLEAAGQLAIGLQLAGLVAVPLQIVNLVVVPRCAKLHQDGDIVGLEALVRTASGLSLGLGLGLALVVLLAVDSILGLLGPSFDAAGELLPILVVGQLINAAFGPNSPALQMIGRDRDAARAESVATVARFIIVACAALAGSLLGVALANAATTALRNVLLSTLLYRRTGILSLPSWSHRRAFAR